MHLDIDTIQPSQLFISEDKLAEVRRLYREKGPEALQPLPVKKIGERIFLTDGHTRAYVLYQEGHRHITAVWDDDPLDWFAYAVCCSWCDDAGILSVKDFDDRVVGTDDYKELWHNRCDELHQQLKEDAHQYISINHITEDAEKRKLCELVLRDLPEWFGIEEATCHYIDGVSGSDFLAAYIGSFFAGFISLKPQFSHAYEMFVLGNFKAFHRTGIGSALIDYATQYARDNGRLDLTVKTLSAAHPDEGYRRTRLFYEKNGFIPLEVFEDLWGEENPCLFMIKQCGI